MRVTPAELARAKEDLKWAFELAEAAMENDEMRLLGTDKAWHAFEFLLDRRGFDIPIVYGAEPFVDLAGQEHDDECLEDPDSGWGYGPPRYLAPDQVDAAAAALASLTEDDLVSGVDQAELMHAEIYPDIWDRPNQLGWVTHHLPYAQKFFATAAKNGDAIICWLD
jgi:hypothetical protein